MTMEEVMTDRSNSQPYRQLVMLPSLPYISHLLNTFWPLTIFDVVMEIRMSSVQLSNIMSARWARPD